MLKLNNLLIGQFWSLFFPFCFQNCHLGIGLFHIHCLIWWQPFIINISFIVPPYTKHYLFFEWGGGRMPLSSRCYLGEFIWFTSWHFLITLLYRTHFSSLIIRCCKNRNFLISFRQRITWRISSKHILILTRWIPRQSSFNFPFKQSVI